MQAHIHRRHRTAGPEIFSPSLYNGIMPTTVYAEIVAYTRVGTIWDTTECSTLYKI